MVMEIELHFYLPLHPLLSLQQSGLELALETMLRVDLAVYPCNVDLDNEIRK